MSEDATTRGKRVIELLTDMGKLSGLDVQTEYPVVGGRIDLVWLWRGPDSFPSVLPLVGFEVESSWRTRKHLKGDYLNLLDLQPALGVIVLLGEGEDVESTRRFARVMVDRHAGRMEIWSEEDVLRLSDSGEAEAAVALLQGSASTREDGRTRPSPGVGKYRAITVWLMGEGRDSVRTSFEEVEEILGFPLPPSARKHNAYWSGGQPGSTVGNAIREAGWRAKDLDLVGEEVTLVRDPTLEAPGAAALQ
jgi:hypothetical protein